MPLLKSWNIQNTTKAAIWKIEEPITFFTDETGIDCEIHNEIRKTEHLAGRFLLKYLEPAFPLNQIFIDEFRKPLLPNHLFHFSISHSFPYVAVVVGKEPLAGIDVQTWHKRISDIQHKFLSSAEQNLIGGRPENITLAWCAKESAYKWHGRHGVDFIEHLPITKFSNGEIIDITIRTNFYDSSCEINLKSMIHADFACTYINSIQ